MKFVLFGGLTCVEIPDVWIKGWSQQVYIRFASPPDRQYIDFRPIGGKALGFWVEKGKPKYTVLTDTEANCVRWTVRKQGGQHIVEKTDWPPETPYEINLAFLGDTRDYSIRKRLPNLRR